MRAAPVRKRLKSRSFSSSDEENESETSLPSDLKAVYTFFRVLARSSSYFFKVSFFCLKDSLCSGRVRLPYSFEISSNKVSRLVTKLPASFSLSISNYIFGNRSV